MKINETRDLNLCIIVPCLNEQDGLYHFYQQLHIVVAKYNYKIIFIDDGSSDGTLEVMEKLACEDMNVKFISLSRNFGHQNALKAGYDHADGDCVICLDSDLQHPPAIIDSLVEKWQQGYDVVYTIRQDQGRVPFLKKIMASAFYKIYNYISKVKLVPNSADFRLVDKKVLSVIQSFNEDNIFIRGLIAWAGFKQFGVNYVVDIRKYGATKYSLRRMLSFSLSGITSFSVSPLRIASFLGFIFAALSFIYGFYALYVHIYTDTTVPGWTSLIASFLFITGLQFILIGLIGEYLGKGFIESKKRPKYLVRTHNL